MFALADRLKKSIFEIEQMPHSEFYEWVAYMKIRDDYLDADCQ